LSNRIVLDTNPLSLLCHGNTQLPEVREIRQWLRLQTQAGNLVYVAEMADYEARRELLRAGKITSVRRLDGLAVELTYLPLDTPTMRRAAEFWAQSRQQGLPTADPKEIDADVILAAQAESVGAIVVTDNVGHLARFVTAKHWRDIP
jgi:predicted nucleic acid-binding protein